MADETSVPAKTGGTRLPVARRGDYAVLSMPPDKLARVKKNFAGRRLRAFDLPRGGMPGGKGKPEWILVDAQGEEFLEEVRGVILDVRDWRAWYRIPYDESGGGSPPSCSSDDCVQGYGDRTIEGSDYLGPHDCLTCPWAQWGSARGTGESRGQDCGEKRAVFMLRAKAESVLPTLLVLPCTSIGPIDLLRNSIQGRGDELWEYEVALKLEKDKSKGGIVFFKAKVELAAKLDPEAVKCIEAWATVFGSLGEVRASQVSADPTKMSVGEETPAGTP